MITNKKDFEDSIFNKYLQQSIEGTKLLRTNISNEYFNINDNLDQNEKLKFLENCVKDSKLIAKIKEIITIISDETDISLSNSKSKIKAISLENFNLKLTADSSCFIDSMLSSEAIFIKENFSDYLFHLMLSSIKDNEYEEDKSTVILSCKVVLKKFVLLSEFLVYYFYFFLANGFLEVLNNLGKEIVIKHFENPNSKEMEKFVKFAQEKKMFLLAVNNYDNFTFQDKLNLLEKAIKCIFQSFSFSSLKSKFIISLVKNTFPLLDYSYIMNKDEINEDCIFLTAKSDFDLENSGYEQDSEDEETNKKDFNKFNIRIDLNSLQSKENFVKLCTKTIELKNLFDFN